MLDAGSFSGLLMFVYFAFVIYCSTHDSFIASLFLYTFYLFFFCFYFISLSHKLKAFLLLLMKSTRNVWILSAQLSHRSVFCSLAFYMSFDSIHYYLSNFHRIYVNQPTLES